MATVKELVTRFGFEIDDKGLKELEGGISAVKDGLLGLGAVMAGTAVALYGIVKTTADYGNELLITSQKVGVGVESLQRLSFQANLADVSSADLSQSLVYLNRNIEEARSGSNQQAEAFRKAGISTAILKDKSFSAEKALGMMATRFQELPDGPQKTAMAMDIFGRSGAKMITLLNEMSRGLTPVQQKVLEMSMITEEQARAGDDFGDSLTVLNTAWKAIVRTVGFELMPVARDVVEQITEWIVENKELVKTNITGFVKALTSALKLTVRIADVLIQALAGVAHGFGGAETATKLFLGTLAVLSSASVLIGIGKLTQSVVTLGNSIGLAGLKAAAIPLLIGAAMVAIFLVMEDIYSFFTGKDSFLGDLLKMLPEVGDVFKTVFEPIFEPFVAFITKITDGVGSWKDLFIELGALVVNVLLTPLRAAVSLIAGISGVAGRIFKSSGLQAFAEGAQAFAGDLTAGGIANTYSGLTGVTPQAAVASGAGGASTNNQLQNTNVFNFPPGTDPATVGPKVSSSVSTGIDDILRQTQRSTANGGAY